MADRQVQREQRPTALNTDMEALRAVAILMVIGAHLPALIPWSPVIDVVATLRLQMGVDLFFMISGYVITLSLWRDFAANGETMSVRQLLLRFWIRRAFRLVPAALAALALALAAAYLFRGHAPYFLEADSFPHLAWGGVAATFNVFNIYAYFSHFDGIRLRPLGIYWSLSLEEQFYALYPLLLLMAANRFHLAIAALGMIVAMYAAYFFLPNGLFWYIRVDGFFLGVLLACIQPIVSGRPLSVNRWLGAAALLVGLPIIAGLTLILPGYWGYHGLPMLMIFALGCLCLPNRGIFGFPLLGPVLQHIGSRSYAIYLLHFLCLLLLQFIWRSIAGHDPGWLGTAGALLSLPLMLVPVEIFHRCIEMPSRTFGRRLADRMARRPSLNLAVPQ